MAALQNPQDALDRLPILWERVIADAEDHGARAELIDAVLGLEVWFGIPQTRENGETGPGSAVIEGIPMLVVFTTATKATAFAVDQGFGELAPLPLVPREVIAQYPAMSEEGLQALILDLTDSAIFVPLPQLAGAVTDEPEV